MSINYYIEVYLCCFMQEYILFVCMFPSINNNDPFSNNNNDYNHKNNKKNNSDNIIIDSY